MSLSLDVCQRSRQDPLVRRCEYQSSGCRMVCIYWFGRYGKPGEYEERYGSD